MNEFERAISSKKRESLLNAFSAGFFFILVGVIFVTTPNLFDKILDFFRDFDMITVPNMQIALPAPTIPNNHLTVYATVGQFSLFWGIFKIATLILRFVFQSPLNKKAENFSDIAFSFGVYYLIGTSLTEAVTRTIWFTFWTQIIMLIGLTMIIRAIVLAFRS